MLKLFALFVLLVAIAVKGIGAETTGKKTVTQDTYKQWKRIERAILSADSNWVAYTMQTGAGERELIVRSTQAPQEFRVSCGIAPGIDSDARNRDLFIHITDDSRFVLFPIIPPTFNADTRSEAHASGLALGILRLPDGRITKIGGVSTLKWPRRSSRYLAWLHSGSMQGVSEAGQNRDTLVLRDLSTGHQVQIAEVVSYEFEPRGRYLAFVVSSHIQGESGVFVRRLRDGKLTRILAGNGVYGSLAFDNSGEQLAVLGASEERDAPEKPYSVYYVSAPTWNASQVVRPETLGEWRISSHDGLKFVDAGNALTFRIRSPSSSSMSDEKKRSGDMASFDLWNWRDPKQALPQGRRARDPSFLAVYHIHERHWVRVSTETITDVTLNQDASQGVGLSAPVALDVRERRGTQVRDVYSIDTRTGKALFLRRLRPMPLAIPQVGSLVSLSPTGRYIVYFEDRRWWSFDLQTHRAVNLTGRLLPEFRFDSPFADSTMMLPEGLGGWTRGDASLLLYSRRDVWRVDPTGAVPPQNLTSTGKRNIMFRLLPDYGAVLNYPYQIQSTVGFRPIEKQSTSAGVLSDTETVLLSAMDLDTMASGIWSVKLNLNSPPQSILMLDKRVTPLARNEKQHFLLTLEDFAESPNLWVGDLRQLRKTSDLNPQQREYRWGTADLINFTSEFGVPLKGVLYRPESLDSAKMYPMIVHVYESGWSARLHRYHPPRLGTFGDALDLSILDFVSRGYLVFQPDVLPVSPYPGAAALSAVRAGVQAVLDIGFADPKRMAITGQSYGGYETAYILAKTDLFRCGVEGAGLTNSVSMYGSASFGPSFYEVGQGRHGSSIWRDPFIYLANSPVMYADRVRAPLLIRHNKGDPNVEFSQGMQFFQALSRNYREVYLFDYHGEGHTLENRANRLDWALRVQHFLDYCLLDAAEPDWMKPV